MNQIAPQELKERVARQCPIVLLGVRQDGETKLCRLG